MIDIKTGGSAPTGINSRDDLIYKPNQKEDFSISRSKVENFIKCSRCFYLNLVRGLMEPDCPKMTLNTLTDTLLKKEFDSCRKKNTSHRILKKYKLNHIVPYKNDNFAKDEYGKVVKKYKGKKNEQSVKLLDAWRDFRYGVRRRFKNTNIILYGAVDDIWFNSKNNELIVADYKSTQKEESIKQETYFDDQYKKGYKFQLDFYAYLLKGQKEINGIDNDISNDAYFLVVNARGLEKSFDGKMIFEEKLIRHTIDDSYLEDTIENMIVTINSTKIPPSERMCKNCAYARQRSKTDKIG
tara:strand:- start:668 stop:1558 length:891 start_codon:yes stop_codon:yes gene_type:complete